ncbi:hypothetical protein [Corynebacterium jeikeium]|uniref:hypothetical protein n=1 Tax=Corynebacterium jeikeium TaxID=38289 RepID=UPI000DA2F886|nr:hypothetical protein [Corynebacterium jeikeium]SQI18627.1 Uncharacterised protein [Corynebacterium jeikeium]
MTDADSNDKNNPLNSGKSVSDAEETSVMKAVTDSDLNAGGAAAGSAAGSATGSTAADAGSGSAAAGEASGAAANPNTPQAQENPANPANPENPEAPETPEDPENPDELEEEKPKSGLRKFFGIMPFWAWVLTLGLIATIIVAIGAFATMRSTETGAPGSSSNTEQLKPSYPKPTTTGKYDDDETPPTPDAGPGYGGGNQNYYAPQEPVQTEQETPTESESESESSEPSSSTKPSRPPRDNEPRPSSPNRGTPRPGGIGGDAGGNPSPGTGNNGNGNGNGNGAGAGNGPGNGAPDPNENGAPDDD